jgi:hypothetical protein
LSAGGRLPSDAEGVGDGVDVVDAGSGVEEGPAGASRLVAGVDVLLAGKEEALQRVLTCNRTRIHQVARYE